MNIFLWVLQVLVALHTVIGAIWKFTNPTQAVPSLTAIPAAAWKALSVVEILCSVALVLPAITKSYSTAVPIGAACIAVEMLLFCGLHLGSGARKHGPVAYWLVVAAICAFLAYARYALKPL